MAVYLLDGAALLDGGSVATSEDCCCQEGCPCQPTHISLAWTAANVDEPMFSESFSDEIDIPPLDAECNFTYHDERTVSAPCPDPATINGIVQFDLELQYDFGLNLWVVYIQIFITAGAFDCPFFYIWPLPASLVATMPGTNTRSFACPPATINEDLLDGAYALFTGHVTANFT